MKRILIILVVLVLLMGAGLLALKMMVGGEPAATPIVKAPDIDVRDPSDPVWTGGGTELINAGIELEDPPMEVLVHDAVYAGLNAETATVAVRVTVNNLGPTGLGKWYQKPNAFALSSPTGVVRPLKVAPTGAAGAQTQLTVSFAAVPTAPLIANEVSLAVRISGDPTTDVAFGLTPPTEDSLGAEKAVPEPAVDEAPTATPPAPAPVAKAPVVKKKKAAAPRTAAQRKAAQKRANANKKKRAAAKAKAKG